MNKRFYKRSIISFLVCAFFMLGFTSVYADSKHLHHSHYAGQERRQIKSLSESDINDLKNGRGWGLAKAAELNGVPGPIHLLEMKEEIGLTPGQTAEIQALYDAMKSKAIQLGNQLIALERRLNHSFEQGHMNEQFLKSILNEISNVHEQLRFTHLSTHLKTPAILTSHQIEQYNRLRGYKLTDS